MPEAAVEAIGPVELHIRSADPWSSGVDVDVDAAVAAPSMMSHSLLAWSRHWD